MVKDSVIVALNLSVMWKKSTFTDSSRETPAEKPTSMGWWLSMATEAVA